MCPLIEHVLPLVEQLNPLMKYVLPLMTTYQSNSLKKISITTSGCKEIGGTLPEHRCAGFCSICGFLPKVLDQIMFYSADQIT
jgi:hypothetical protein